MIEDLQETWTALKQEKDAGSPKMASDYSRVTAPLLTDETYEINPSPTLQLDFIFLFFYFYGLGWKGP